jgi:hypothetical protein
MLEEKLFAFATLSPCDTFRARHANAGSGLFSSSFCGCSWQQRR